MTTLSSFSIAGCGLITLVLCRVQGISPSCHALSRGGRKWVAASRWIGHWSVAISSIGWTSLQEKSSNLVIVNWVSYDFLVDTLLFSLWLKPYIKWQGNFSDLNLTCKIYCILLRQTFCPHRINCLLYFTMRTFVWGVYPRVKDAWMEVVASQR